MGIVEYTSELFDLLKQTVEKLPLKTSLTHQNFVDYYYTKNDWCKLFLLMPNSELISGIVGVERMRFEYNNEEMMFGFGNNFYSLVPGVGGLLFLRWMQECPYAIEFGGSEDAHRIIERQKWTKYCGIKTYFFNRLYSSSSDDNYLKSFAKKTLNLVRIPKKLSGKDVIQKSIKDFSFNISIKEEKDYTSDILPKKSPFVFRFAPTIDYLKWRYNTNLSFVHYRLFRILLNDETTGYVILNDAPNQIMVSHCDGDDVNTLALGILLSIAELSKDDEQDRQVLLTSSHPQMQKIFESFGFKESGSEYYFALGSPKKNNLPAQDTSNWLVNFDWGDNGLRMQYFH